MSKVLSLIEVEKYVSLGFCNLMLKLWTHMFSLQSTLKKIAAFKMFLLHFKEAKDQY